MKTEEEVQEYLDELQHRDNNTSNKEGIYTVKEYRERDLVKNAVEMLKWVLDA